MRVTSHHVTSDAKMTDDDRYKPISCGFHSELELAIMHKQWLRVAWHDNETLHVESLLPQDIQTSQHEEFLIAEAQNGSMRRIRLDRIDSKQAIEYD